MARATRAASSSCARTMARRTFTKGVLTLEIPKTVNAPVQGKQIEVKPG